MTRKMVWFIVMINLVLITAASALYVYEQAATAPLSFDSDGWRFGDEDTRGRMVGSLLTDPLASSPGMLVEGKCPAESVIYNASADEVMRLLGQPLDVERRGTGLPIQWVTYRLGNRGFWVRGPFVLNIYFDENGIVDTIYLGD